MKVIKRDGSTADFDSSTIIVAIQKATQVVEPDRSGTYRSYRSLCGK